MNVILQVNIVVEMDFVFHVVFSLLIVRSIVPIASMNRRNTNVIRMKLAMNVRQNHLQLNVKSIWTIFRVAMDNILEFIIITNIVAGI